MTLDRNNNNPNKIVLTMDNKIKRFIAVVFSALFISHVWASSPQSVGNTDAGVKTVDFAYFTTLLPSESEKNAFWTDLRSISYITPNKDFFYYVCFFEMGEDFDQTERLKEECSETFDTSTRPMMLTVGGNEPPLLFYASTDDDILFFTGVFADYINNVGIYINCVDRRNVSSAEKIALLSSFRRPEERKVDFPDWISAAIALRGQSEYGSVDLDELPQLTYTKFKDVEVKIPKGLPLKSDDGDIRIYENASQAFSVLVLISSLEEDASAVSELYSMASLYNLELINLGAGICEHGNGSTVFYTGNMYNPTKVAIACMADESQKKLVRVSAVCKDEDADANVCWSIVRSLKFIR